MPLARPLSTIRHRYSLTYWLGHIYKIVGTPLLFLHALAVVMSSKGGKLLNLCLHLRLTSASPDFRRSESDNDIVTWECGVLK
jgi:hypothetical protein